MNDNTILITDTLFIANKHERLLKNMGFSIERIDSPQLSEEELCEAIKGKVGYILGGIEIVTSKVIEAADKLKAIAFTGAGYTEFIPAYKQATKKGILISNTPGGNADAVAEFSIMLMLMMIRQINDLGRCGQKSFQTTPSLKDKTIGLIGLGRIGLLVAHYLKALGVKNILYFSNHRKFHLENGLGISFVQKDDLLSRSDIISLHISKEAGDEFISNADLRLMQKETILINTSFPDIVDLKTLYELLEENKIRVAFDKKPEIDSSYDFSKFSPNNCFYSNSQTAFNTIKAIETVSEMATRSIINLLTVKNDTFCVNK